MSNLPGVVADFAAKVFQQKLALVRNRSVLGLDPFPDAVLAAASAFTHVDATQLPEAQEVIEQVFATSDFQAIAPRSDELDPMVISPYGGIRAPSNQIIRSLFSAAFQKMYFLGLPLEENTYVRTVLEGLDELRKAIKGGTVNAYRVFGVAGVTISNGRKIDLPWGTLQTAPAAGTPAHLVLQHRPQTTCLLVQSQTVPVIFDRQPQPDRKFDPSYLTQQRHTDTLFPLSCALASRDPLHPISALRTWETTLLPFQSLNSFGAPLISKWFIQATSIDSSIGTLEEWARTIEQNHTPAVDLAVNRLLSAISQRNDAADSLIDAVMVWENLLGTSHEVTFRVTAALSKIIESDPAARREKKRQLADVYSVRSKLVHGAAVESHVIIKSCEIAVGAAIQALCFSYKAGQDWLSASSEERSTKVLLEW